jgi:hypothetical protein
MGLFGDSKQEKRKMRYSFLVAMLVIACAVAMASDEEISFGKDASGAGYYAVIDGHHEPVFWRIPYTHGECPFLHFYKDGTIRGGSYNGADCPYVWGTVVGRHLELFPLREDSDGAMVGFPLENLTRDPRSSEWWQKNLLSEKEADQAEQVSPRTVVDGLIGCDTHKGLLDLVMADIGLTDEKMSRGEVLEKIKRWDARKPTQRPGK